MFPTARYGLTVYFGPVLDRCLVNENVKYGVITYEITDIRRDEVLFTIERGGGTGHARGTRTTCSRR